MDHLHHEVYRRYHIHIFADDFPGNPREQWDNMGRLLLFGDRGWYMGDKEVECSLDAAQEYWESGTEDGAIPLEEEMNRGVILPVYYRDCGSAGCKLYCGNPDHLWDFDGGQSGWIWADTKTIVKEYGDYTPETIAKAQAYLEGEIETLRQYFNGEACGYVVSRPKGETIDSCWGFYGYDYCLEEARNVVKSIESRKRKERLTRLLQSLPPGNPTVPAAQLQ